MKTARYFYVSGHAGYSTKNRADYPIRPILNYVARRGRFFLYKLRAPGQGLRPSVYLNFFFFVLYEMEIESTSLVFYVWGAGP
jgi:hypothetical protein